MKTITLIGMMGAGKTSVGSILAEKLGLNFFDVDKIIEQAEGCSISDIFSTKGEKYFRNLERDVIKEVIAPQNKVISLGGGAFENFETRKILLDNSTIIYLKASPDTIFYRIKSDNSRPLLKDKMSINTITDILDKREQNYLLANHIILTDNKSLEQVVMEILKCVS